MKDSFLNPNEMVCFLNDIASKETDEDKKDKLLQISIFIHTLIKMGLFSKQA